MKTKEKYQACLDQAYQHAPFRIVDIIDSKYCPWPPPTIICTVCGNTRLRYLCKCTDKDGAIWYIGSDCHTKLEERYEQDHK